MGRRWHRRGTRSARSGFTLIELSISMAVIATLMLAASAGFYSSLSAVGHARKMTSSSIFLETTMEDLSAQPYESVLALNGAQFFSGTDANDSQYRIDLATFLIDIRLLQVQAVVLDLGTDREVCRLSSLRSQQ